jgi:hypothetical protein
VIVARVVVWLHQRVRQRVRQRETQTFRLRALAPSYSCSHTHCDRVAIVIIALEEHAIAHTNALDRPGSSGEIARAGGSHRDPPHIRPTFTRLDGTMVRTRSPARIPPTTLLALMRPVGKSKSIRLAHLLALAPRDFDQQRADVTHAGHLQGLQRARPYTGSVEPRTLGVVTRCPIPLGPSADPCSIGSPSACRR